MNTSMQSAWLRLSLHDLEIRGAGNFLGREQSGYINDVGFDMYMELLEQTIAELKGETITENIIPEINIPIPAFIPDDYIADVNERLLFYRRLSASESSESLSHLKQEIRERFGPIPTSLENLLCVIDMRRFLKEKMITELAYNNKEIIISFFSVTPSLADRIVEILKWDGERLRFTKDMRLKIKFDQESWEKIFAEVRSLLQSP